MRSTHGLLLSCATVVGLYACSADPEQQPPPAGGPSQPQSPDQAAQSGPPASVVISLDANGAVVVTPESLEVREKGKSPVVGWTAGDGMANRAWLVGFGGGSPFQNGRVSFSSDPGRNQAPIASDATAQEYKYWVWVSDGSGGWTPLDPKIVIIDDPGADTTRTGPAGPS